MGDEIKITFQCKSCGGTVLDLPDDYNENSIAKCKSCGTEFGTWGAIRARGIEAAKDEIHQKFKDAFKGLKGWKVR